MAAYQKRLLTAENSRLGKVDIVSMLQKDKAWTSLPRGTREHLYTLLPPANDSEPPRDPDVNPLQNERLKPYIEDELRRWKEDLQEGRETKKWRVDAMQAGKDHVDGKFDQWKVIAREEYWGKPGAEKAEEDGESKADEKAEAIGIKAADMENSADGKEDEKVKGNGAEVGKVKSDDGKEVEDSQGEGSEL